MLIHLYIGWALAYGWMTCLLLLHKGILGHFMQKITKKVCFLGFASRKFIFWDRNSKLATNVFKRMLLIIEHVVLVWIQWTPCCEWFWGKNHQKWVIFVISHNLNVTLWTIPNSQLNTFGLENYPKCVETESELCLNIFMICYVLGHFTEKLALKLVILGICFWKVQFS